MKPVLTQSFLKFSADIVQNIVESTICSKSHFEVVEHFLKTLSERESDKIWETICYSYDFVPIWILDSEDSKMSKDFAIIDF